MEYWKSEEVKVSKGRKGEEGNNGVKHCMTIV